MKKVLSLVLVLVNIFTLCACGPKLPEATPQASSEISPKPSPATTPEETAAASKLYIPVIAKGFQHQYWQAVKKGAEDAAREFGAEIYFDGPASESEIQAQVDMLKKEMTKNPKALALAALDTDAVAEILKECTEKNIPVIGFDSGVPSDTNDAVVATARTNNEAAAVLAAEKLGEQKSLVEAMIAATAENPMVIACISQDTASVNERTTGFVNKMKEIAAQYGIVTVEGDEKWAESVDKATIMIRVEIPADANAASIQSSASKVLELDGLKAVFLSSEDVVNGFLSVTADQEDLADGGKYAELLIAGFGAGTAQKNAVRQGWFLGSVTQDPYNMGYNALELAVKAAKGEAVSDRDIDAQWYDSSNLSDEMVALLVYD